MANGELLFTIRDNNGDLASTGIHTGAVTAVSLPGLLSEVGSLRGAIEGITLGVVAREALSVFQTTLSGARAASTLAQTEIKWLCRYHDDTAFFDDPVNAIPNAGYGKVFTFQIPTADLSLLAQGEETLDITTPATPGQIFKSFFDATARSPYGGVGVLDEIRLME